VHQRTKDAAHAWVAAGVPFIIATGRPPRLTQPVADDLGHHSIAICSNGAVTVDLTDNGRVIDEQMIEPREGLNAVEVVRSFLPDASFAVDRLTGFAHSPNYIPRWELPPNVRVAPIEDLLDGPALKVMFRDPGLTQNLLREITAAIGTNGSLTYGAHTPDIALADVLVEVMAPGVHKASALARYCATLGIEASEVVAFGDMPNDAEMLAWAGHGVAMANGHRDLKALANEVALSNNEHGVARVLERLLPSR
jgi:hydroxymethylpyrimidine pyrophosphatase-like HAD family hydrolase